MARSPMTIIANGDTDIGDVGVGIRGIMLVTVTGIGAANITVKQRPRGTANAWVTGPYYTKRSDGTKVAGSTTITADGTYEIEATGSEIRLTTAAWNQNIALDFEPVLG